VSPSSTRHFDASRLREAQAKTGLTNEAVADRVGVKLRLLQKWRAGSVSPSGWNVIALGQVLECPPESFYVDEPTTGAAA
jgi:DNA-binding transcriptional regulator YiaG